MEVNKTPAARGGGDAPSGARGGEEADWDVVQRTKQRKVASPTKKGREPREREESGSSQVPFPLDNTRRADEVVLVLMKAAATMTYPVSQWIFEICQARYPNEPKGKLIKMSNQICFSISEFHTTCTVREANSVSPMVPPTILARLPSTDKYLPDCNPELTMDVREIEQANILRYAVYLHRLEREAESTNIALSCNRADHPVGHLLRYFLYPAQINITESDIINCVLEENVAQNKRDIWHYREKKTELELQRIACLNKLDDVTSKYRQAHKQTPLRARYRKHRREIQDELVLS